MTTINLREAPRPFNAAPQIPALLGYLACVFGLACSSPRDLGTPNAGPGDPNVLAGTFQVRLVPPAPGVGGSTDTPGYTDVRGKVYSGPSPSYIVWEPGNKAGDCQLLLPRIPFCSTPCGGAAACVEDDTCLPYPDGRLVGKVTARGLKTADGDTQFTMEPFALSYQIPEELTLAFPPFAEGDAIRFEASGDDYSAFAIDAKGVSVFELLSGPITLEPNKAVNLLWTPPLQAGLSRIHVSIDISHHGGIKGIIECDAEDTGSLELPSTLLTELLNLGVAGFPTIHIARRFVGSTTIEPGRVDLAVVSDVLLPIEIPGLTSCNDDSSCPNGQTCQPDETCQ